MKNKVEAQKVLDSIRQQKIEAALQPFKLVKYFSFTSLGVILIVTLFLSVVISNHARTIMLERSEEYSRLLAENLNQQVFRRFVLPAVIKYGGIALSNTEQFDFLDRVVQNVIQGLKIDSVTIYDSSVNIISYSTVPDLVGKKDVGKSEYEKALKGISNSKFVSSGSLFSLLPWAKPVNSRLQTYIPFRQVKQSGEHGDIIMGVIEIDKNLSLDYQAIIRLQGRIILVSNLVMAMLFLVLRTIVSRADKIMAKRGAERFALEEKLNQAERLAHLGTMVATVSHEIKSPLGIVRSTAEILEGRIKKVAPGNEHLATIIVEETTRLNNIVMEFLDFARPQDAKLIPSDINGIINQTLQFLGPKLEEKKIQLDKELDETLGQVHCDPELLYRALLNILINAIQALGDGGLLSVQTQKGGREGAVKISVRDNGIGISSEKIKNIFEPFFTDKHKGTGLGLAITSNIIENHNGKIWAESKEGEGTSFFIILP